jgi:hypothetical protein
MSIQDDIYARLSGGLVTTPFYIELLDAANKKATGYLAGVGAGETLGSEIATGTLTLDQFYKVTATDLGHFTTGKGLVDGFILDVSRKLWLPLYAHGAEVGATMPDHSGNGNNGTIYGAIPNPGDEDAIVDGGFNYWPDPALQPNYWQRSISGDSTVNRDGVNQRSGLYCCRFDVGTTGKSQIKNNVGVAGQGIRLIQGRQYILTIWYKNSMAGKTGQLLFTDPTTVSISLKLDGTWQAGTHYQTIPNATVWTPLTITFTPDPSCSIYELYLYYPVSIAGSSSVYFDDISLVPTSDLKPAIGWNFDAADDYISVPAISIPSAVSGLIWVHSNDLVQDGGLIYAGSAGVGPDWLMDLELDLEVLCVQGNGGTKRKYNIWDLPLNVWRLFAFIITGTTGTLFIDGEQVYSNSVTAIGNNGNPISIGRNVNNYFNGNVGDVQVFNRALTEAEITAYYDLTRTKFAGLAVNEYFTSYGTEICEVINKVKRVTDPPATAVHIVSSLNGTTRNWASIESGFDPNTIASWKIYDLAHPGFYIDSAGSTFNRGDFTATNAFFWSSIDLSPYAGTLITAATGLTALVGTKIYPLTVPQDIELPYVSYFIVSDVPEHAMGTDAEIETVRLQVSCWADTYDVAKAIEVQVRAALSRYRSGNIKDIFFENSLDLYDGEEGVYHVPCDFIIFYSEV